MKKNKILSFATTWLTPEDTVLCKSSQAHKDKCQMFKVSRSTEWRGGEQRTGRSGEKRRRKAGEWE